MYADYAVNETNLIDTLDELGYEWDAFGENVAFELKSSNDVFEAWLNVTVHRENIQDPFFTEVGVGYSITDAPYWTVNFAAPIVQSL